MTRKGRSQHRPWSDFAEWLRDRFHAMLGPIRDLRSATGDATPRGYLVGPTDDRSMAHGDYVVFVTAVEKRRRNLTYHVSVERQVTRLRLPAESAGQSPYHRGDPVLDPRIENVKLRVPCVVAVSSPTTEVNRADLRGDTKSPVGPPHSGARDSSAPRRVITLTLSHQLYFAIHDEGWGGGVAFVNGSPEVNERTLACGYQLTREQFEDVFAQENEAATIPVDITDLEDHGELIVHDKSPYGRILLLDHRDNVPLLTFTAPWEVGDVEPQAPAPTYLYTIAKGIQEQFHLSRQDIGMYLVGKSGVTPAYSFETLMDILSTL